MRQFYVGRFAPVSRQRRQLLGELADAFGNHPFPLGRIIDVGDGLLKVIPCLRQWQ